MQTPPKTQNGLASCASCSSPPERVRKIEPMLRHHSDLKPVQIQEHKDAPTKDVAIYEMQHSVSRSVFVRRLNEAFSRLRFTGCSKLRNSRFSSAAVALRHSSVPLCDWWKCWHGAFCTIQRAVCFLWWNDCTATLWKVWNQHSEDILGLTASWKSFSDSCFCYNR